METNSDVIHVQLVVIPIVGHGGGRILSGSQDLLVSTSNLIKVQTGIATPGL